MSKSLKKLIDINRLREFKNKLVEIGSAYVQTGAVNQTVAGTKTFSKPIVGSVTGSSGSCTGNAATATTATTAKACTGNAATATKLQTARTINGTGFNGTANITTANWGTARDITIADSTGDNTGEAVSVNGSAAVTLKLPATIKASLDGNAATATSATTAASATTATNATNAAKLGNIASSGYVQTGKVNQTIDGTKTFSAAIVGSVTGNAGSATKLATARTINGTAFNGTANITTTNWGTARNITITDGTNTSTAVSVNGSADVALTLPATIKANLTGNCSGSSGSCTGNAATATTATTAKACTGNSATATKATQDAAGNTITTTYATKAENNIKANNSEVVHKSGDETIAGTKTFSNGVLLTNANALMVQNGEYTLVLRHDSRNTYLLMSDKGGVPGTWSDARPLVISNSTGVCSINGNADSATNATYANWLRTSSHTDHLFHTEWDKAGYFWTYVTTGSGEYRAVRVARSDSSGNADTATKLATARTIALSGAATGTATAFDGSGNITIPVTALAASAIRAQWYAAYPDGPEAHNAMWGGRDITAAFNNKTVSANIANGTFRDIFPGDYITKQVIIQRVFADDGVTVIFEGGTYTVNWVIADCDYWINKGDTAMTTHHVAIVPQAPIFNARMHPTNTTAGGCAGSDMYRKIIPACVRGIISAFGSSHILTFRDSITNSVDTSSISSGAPFWTGASSGSGWYDARCNLMSEAMVYGGPHYASSALDNIVATRQMSAFRLSERLINYNRQWWWLRDVISSTRFAGVDGAGSAGANNASYARGVRPFALLK